MRVRTARRMRCFRVPRTPLRELVKIRRFWDTQEVVAVQFAEPAAASPPPPVPAPVLAFRHRPWVLWPLPPPRDLPPLPPALVAAGPPEEQLAVQLGQQLALGP